ncbi:DoxX family protein [Thiorhodococcus minor]|uniref:DoxX family protein n=1 Tax=Thiorhodococcus minor TaxID=57489 RepID=A0A6M0K7J8_9GAMM|nr:DoxX family protein [Thiorhodococcus minor]NEV64903.1 DoxX family protein [Thiorhodococcus minor]
MSTATHSATLSQLDARTRLHTRIWSPSAHAHWLPRAAVAAVFFYHGMGKLADLAGFAGMMELPIFIAALVAIAEVGGGLALILGGALRRDWLTRLGGLAIAPVMLGAILMVHWGQWSFVATESHPMGGMEFQVVLLALAFWYGIAGNDKRA